MLRMTYSHVSLAGRNPPDCLAAAAMAADRMLRSIKRKAF